MRIVRLLVVTTLVATIVSAASSSRQAAVNKAIEQTKSRQMSSSISTNPRVPQRSNSSPGKTESLDVERLNKLIRALDKTWIMPKAGSKDPVGSNFQYKKTCASIYKARHGACQQLGFGIMCFNYCHERGDKLSFKCQDASDAAYCRQSGTFDTFLAKYRKDGYKAKAYIHQMISRCFATSICNTQSGLLNSTVANEEIDNTVEKTTKANRLKLLTKPPGGLKMFKLKTKSTTAEPPVDEVEEEIVEETTAAKKKVTVKSLKAKPTTAAPTTTTKTNIWDKFTVGQKGKPTPKYIPFWQKLMTTTSVPTEEEEETEEPSDNMATPGPEKAGEDATEVEEDLEEDVVVTKAPVQKTNQEKQKVTTTTSTTTEAPTTTEAEVEEELEETTTPSRHTFKPLATSAPELSFQKPGIDGSGPGFWNRFQPNRWFQSIHYVTNTGR